MNCLNSKPNTKLEEKCPYTHSRFIGLTFNPWVKMYLCPSIVIGVRKPIFGCVDIAASLNFTILWNE